MHSELEKSEIVMNKAYIYQNPRSFENGFFAFLLSSSSSATATKIYSFATKALAKRGHSIPASCACVFC